MLIKKTFHFYAAHRNQHLEGKCSNLHGHRYGLSCFFLTKRGKGVDQNVTTLFEVFDDVEHLIKEEYDHACLIDITDPLYTEIKKSSQQWKLKKLGLATSAENLCYVLFHDILSLDLDLIEIHLQETDSSTVIYTVSDFNEDHEPLQKLIESAHPSAQCPHLEFDDKLRCKQCGRTRHNVYTDRKRTKTDQQTADPPTGEEAIS